MNAVLAWAMADAAGCQHGSPSFTVVTYNRKQNCQIYSDKCPAPFAGHKARLPRTGGKLFRYARLCALQGADLLFCEKVEHYAHAVPLRHIVF